MANQKELDEFVRELRPFKWHGFYHYTDFSNLIGIMKEGRIYCGQEAKRKKLQQWETCRREIGLAMGVDLSEYVRFYYTSKPTLLYEAEGIKADTQQVMRHLPIPVILIFKPEIMLADDVLFCDGDAENRNSFFYDNARDARVKLDWSNIFSKLDFDTEDFYMARVRNAEFLCPKEVDLDMVEAIIFRTDADMKNAVNACGFDPRYMVDKSKFFNFKGWNNVGVGANRRKNVFNYMMNYDINVEGNLLRMKYRFASDDIQPFNHEFKITYEDGTEQIDSSNYDDNAVEWEIEEELKKDGPFEVSYSMNGHRVIYWYSE